ncbi:hypothetical protein T440DRAFT_262325 [Plenodomus tracheiphilus IPT5]|uniref:RBR-type E3 ubiquitin transferase n=1 Tax=Plenodomus tracheiphilus IPT5 TaxID=1408161 RepID=A0A6A7ATS0_9PLEO|nr:hypothetical protein T440DRAFT_262325 [Plenodomus tracheiphilus IPT5]
MANTTWSRMRCPSRDCTQHITHADVQNHAPVEVFARFDELSIRSYLSAETAFLYCLAPTCESGQIHDTGTDGPIYRCNACNFRMCTAHTRPIAFHENETCTQYDERIERERIELEARETETRVRREQEEASAAENSKTAVECPGCGSMITKSEGCDHMTYRAATLSSAMLVACHMQGQHGTCGRLSVSV